MPGRNLDTGVVAGPSFAIKKTYRDTAYFWCNPSQANSPGTGSKTRIPLSHSWKPMMSKGRSCRNISQCEKEKRSVEGQKHDQRERENQDICREQRRKTWTNKGKQRNTHANNNICLVIWLLPTCSFVLVVWERLRAPAHFCWLGVHVHFLLISFVAAIPWLIS